MGVLLMLMTIGGLAVAVVLLAISFITRKSWLTKFTIGCVLIWFVFYAILLFGTSLMSKEKNLSLNQPKEFCGFYFDCHMHTAVGAVRKTKTIGDRTAKGDFYIVKVNVFSDAVRATLGLHTVDAHIVDASKREYNRDIEAETQLPPQPPFEKKIASEENFEKEIVFDLPADVQTPRLDIREGGIDFAIEKFLIGDEDSILHKRTYFNISEQNTLAGVK